MTSTSKPPPVGAGSTTEGEGEESGEGAAVAEGEAVTEGEPPGLASGPHPESIVAARAAARTTRVVVVGADIIPHFSRTVRQSAGSTLCLLSSKTHS
jgi:hypothetical protein